MGHMAPETPGSPQESESEAEKRIRPERLFDEGDVLVTPVIGPAGIAVDRNSLCTYIRDRGL